jgi:hypothetical protein
VWDFFCLRKFSYWLNGIFYVALLPRDRSDFSLRVEAMSMRRRMVVRIRDKPRRTSSNPLPNLSPLPPVEHPPPRSWPDATAIHFSLCDLCAALASFAFFPCRCSSVLAQAGCPTSPSVQSHDMLYTWSGEILHTSALARRRAGHTAGHPPPANPGQGGALPWQPATRPRPARRCRRGTPGMAGQLSLGVQPGAPTRSARHADPGQRLVQERAALRPSTDSAGGSARPSPENAS